MERKHMSISVQEQGNISREMQKEIDKQQQQLRLQIAAWHWTKVTECLGSDVKIDQTPRVGIKKVLYLIVLSEIYVFTNLSKQKASHKLLLKELGSSSLDQYQD
jgi:hypothetical protein